MSLDDVNSVPFYDRFAPMRKHEMRARNGVAANGRRGESASDTRHSARELLELLPAAIYTTDAAGRITFYNQAAADLWGCRPKLGDDKWCGSWRLYEPDGSPMPHAECPMAVALKENRAVRGMEAMAERPDGTRVPFIPYPTPLHDAQGNLIGAVNMLIDITERKASEEALHDREARLELLAQEIDHRGNNLLGTVMALARMTQADTVADFVERFMGRLNALSRVHSLLSESRWRGADLRQMMEDELAAYRTDDGRRVKISGWAISLSPEVGQALAMAIHELATNAVKHGALACEGGTVTVEWNRLPCGDLVLRWTEAGLPEIAVPSHKGFGTNLIERSVTMQMGGEVAFEWSAGGLACEIIVPGDKLAHRQHP